MKDKKHSETIDRREFLQKSALLAASAFFMSFGASKVLGALNDNSTAKLIEDVTLNNGVKMPILGFGTLYLNGSEGERCVAEAISLGYRLIDTATIYGNEAAVGAGIKLSGIKREELFVTSKLWVDDSGYEGTKRAFQTSLNKLGLEYLDLYLIHRPRGDVKGSWQAMEELYREGKIRAIGVSNFSPEQLTDLMSYSTIKPVINQIETHAYFQQSQTYDALKQQGVQTEAWAPFAEGRNGLFTNPTLTQIGAKYNKTAAQVSLRWLYQRGIVAIPRTSQKAHMIENLTIFDFKLNESEMSTISQLDLNTTQFPEWS